MERNKCKERALARLVRPAEDGDRCFERPEVPVGKVAEAFDVEIVYSHDSSSVISKFKANDSASSISADSSSFLGAKSPR